ncbi:MAG TPA: rod shape-determining protein MreD [Gammaproteobacteria bacterium]|nr:rod shape-determining protein MreD [Gammaproteobacteria bacterium]
MRSLRLGGVFALFFALVLAVVPLPNGIAPFRPSWVGVALLYWTLVAPESYGLLTAFLCGLALDTLTGALLGQHALALVLIVYLAQRFYLQLRAFPASQLAATIAVLLGLYEFVLFWIDGVAGRSVPAVMRLWPIVSGTVLWFLVWSVFEGGRRDAPERL